MDQQFGGGSLCSLVSRLRYRQLALLVALGEHGNLHRAAAAIHVTQPSATKLVRQLERLFGGRLFDRLPRGMHPTELGSEALAFAQRAMAHLHRFEVDLEHRSRGGKGRLLLGAIPGAASDQVARAIAELKRQRPLLAISLLSRAVNSSYRYYWPAR